MSHAKIGRAGKKNCRVIGRTKELRSNIATTVLSRGPGFWITQSEKIPRKARNRYCPSHIVHLCDCSARSVSRGFMEVWRAVIEEAGDCRLRIFDRSFRRILWGTRSFNDRHGSCTFAFAKAPSCHEGDEACMAPRRR
jgi:hypothetical protein